MKIRSNQSVCEWKGVEPLAPEIGSKIRIALGTLKELPINGLRHLPENDSNGWFIWCGEEMTSEKDFFSPLHIHHIQEYLPQVEEYLSLPPGYRFLIDGENYEDVWQDLDLLK